MKLNAVFPFITILMLIACGPTSNDDSSGASPTVAGDDYYVQQINHMIATGTNRADAETTMLRDRLQDDARDYVVSRKLPAGSGWTRDNLMFERVANEAALRAIVEEFSGYPDMYAPIFAKLKHYSSATFIGLSNDTYCMLYFNADGVLVDGSIF